MDASPPPYSETPPDPLSQPVTNNSLSYNPRISDDPFSQNNQLPNPTSIPDTSSKFFIRRIDNSPGSIGTPGSLETRQTTTIIPSLSPPIEHIFPQAFGFYHASMSDMVIALSAPSSTSRPLFYISTHNTFTIKPDIVLHSRNYEASPPLATVTFHSFTNIKDLDIFLPSGRVQESLQSEGLFNPVYSFTINVGRLGVGEFARERFEWKSSNGNEVQALNGGSHGMKLVRTMNNEVLAAWAPPSSGTNKKGKMSFLKNSREVFGTTWEIATVISILGLMESKRRKS